MTTKEQLAKELEQIGLSDSEARVYLGSLALGPDTAQHIAAKAGVSRPTTYIMIENLLKKGLMSKFKKGKKFAFAAAAPHQLLYVLQNEREQITKKEESVRALLGQFDKLTEETAAPHVFVAEGLEAVRQLQHDILASDPKQIGTIMEITALAKARKFLPAKFSGDRRHEIAKRFKVKALYASSEEKLAPSGSNVEARAVDPAKVPVSGEVVIFGEKVAFTSYGDKLTVVTIASKDVADTLKTMFLGLWGSTKV